MSDSDNKNNKDPFDFFKLSSEPPKKGDPKGKMPKIPFWAILLGILVLTTIINVFFMTRTDSTIDFTQFKQLIQKGQIIEVELGENYFTGYGPGSSAATTTTAFFDQEAQGRTAYKTAAIWTEGFLEFLDENNVIYKATVTQRDRKSVV